MIDGVADVRVGVLDDDVAFGVAPDHVEGPHRSPAEVTLDARPAERAEHDAVELAGAVHLGRCVGAPNAVISPARNRSLSCQLALVTWNGSREPLASPARRRRLNVTNVSAVAISPDAMPRRHRRRSSSRARRASGTGASGVWLLNGPCDAARGLGRGNVRVRQLARHERASPTGGVDGDRRLPVRSRNAPSGHSSRFCPVARPARRMPRSSIEVAERGKVDVLVLRPRTRARPRCPSGCPSGAIRCLNRVRPPWNSALASRHLEAIRHPLERALEIPEAVIVDARFSG